MELGARRARPDGPWPPTSPLPIYAVIDPTDTSNEVHDWVAPVDITACADDYPVVAGGDGSTGGDYNSVCPTTNNEAWFLQQFDGAAARQTNLTVRQADLVPTADGKSISVTVHASADTGRVNLNVYACRPTSTTCSPATSTKPLNSSPIVIGAIPRGGSATKTFALSLPTGQWIIYAQVSAVDNWEPPGGGPFDRVGSLRDNQARVLIAR